MASIFSHSQAAAGLFNPGILRQYRLFESSDLDDTRERISRVMQPHTLRPLTRPAQRHRSHMDFMRIGGIGLGTIDFGEAMRVDVDAVEDYHLLMFCLRGQAETNTNGRSIQVDSRHGVICAPGESFVADLSPDCEQLVVRLDRSVVAAHCGQDIRFDPLLNLDSAGVRAWLDQLQLLTTSSSLLETMQRHAVIAAELERMLIRMLQQGQNWTTASAPAYTSATHRRAPASGCVRRAEMFIEAHADESLRLADIAEAAGVPARTLLDAFHRFRDYSPIQYLRDVRLERAHQRLRDSNVNGKPSVAAVALDCGFTHLGRFSQAYQQRFGMPPSATLAACRRKS